MIRLPNKLLVKNLVTMLIVAVAMTLSTNKVLAASAWINPGTGTITGNTVGDTWSPRFKVSVMLTSYDSEPEMSGATINIAYPSNVKVISIDEGDFDTYVKKDFNATTNSIEIQAVNQAGTYKTGEVRLASITFEPLSNTGEVQLTINSNSVISGSGGEQLLTETINGVYTLNIQDPSANETTTTTTTGSTGTETTVTETTTGAQIETGITDSLSTYLLVSLGLIASGLVLGGVVNSKTKTIA